MGYFDILLFFYTKSSNPVWILHLQYISAWISRNSSAQYPHVAYGYGIGQHSHILRFEFLLYL